MEQLLNVMSALAKCLEHLKQGDEKFFPGPYLYLHLAHLRMWAESELVLMNLDAKEARSALSRDDFEAALRHVHSSKSRAESVLSVMPEEGHLGCQDAADLFADIYRKMGNENFSWEWRRVAEKERAEVAGCRKCDEAASKLSTSSSSTRSTKDTSSGGCVLF